MRVLQRSPKRIGFYLERDVTPMWRPNPILRPVRELRLDIERTVLGAIQRLKGVLGTSDELHHVGSTALLPLLTGGTVDILVLTETRSLPKMRAAIAKQAELQDLPLPVKVDVDTRLVPNASLQIRQLLATNLMVMGEFLALQKQFEHIPGRRYAEAKQEFFDAILSQARYSLSPFDRTHLAPFQIELSTERLRLVSPLGLDGEEHARYQSENQAFHTLFGSQRSTHLEPPFWQRRFAEESIARLRREALTFLVRRGDTDALVGACHFSGFLWGRYQRCAVGFNIAEAAQGNGFMTEAVKAAIDYVSNEWGVHRFEAFYEAENVKSAKLLERLGFAVEGVLANYLWREERWRDCTLAATTRGRLAPANSHLLWPRDPSGR